MVLGQRLGIHHSAKQRRNVNAKDAAKVCPLVRVSDRICFDAINEVQDRIASPPLHERLAYSDGTFAISGNVALRKP